MPSGVYIRKFSMSQETKRKISEARKGIKFSEEHKRKLSESRKGKIQHLWSKESRQKASKARLGKSLSGNRKIGWKLSEETRKNMSLAKKKMSIETRIKISKGHKGSKHYAWIEDKSKLSRINKQGERRTSAYNDWRKQVWLRDNFTCKIANPDCNGRIEAHHILAWSEHPELHYQINNGITLCHAHHPRVRAEEKRMIPIFQELLSVSK